MLDVLLETNLHAVGPRALSSANRLAQGISHLLVLAVLVRQVDLIPERLLSLYLILVGYCLALGDNVNLRGCSDHVRLQNLRWDVCRGLVIVDDFVNTPLIVVYRTNQVAQLDLVRITYTVFVRVDVWPTDTGRGHQSSSYMDASSQLRTGSFEALLEYA